MEGILGTDQSKDHTSQKIVLLKDWREQRNKPFSQRPFNGPMSSKMWESVERLKSKMPNEFDWSVYDQLFERFGDKQPRGGVLFKTHLKLVNHHSTCTRCHYAFEIDTYGRGCLHNCVYCYAKEALTQHGYWNQPFPFPIDLSEVRKVFATVFETNKRSKWRTILEQRVPLRMGSMSDSFMHVDKKYGVTKELLRILKHYNYPYIVFTRSDLIAEDEYLALLDRNLAAVQFSISGTDEKLTRALEPGAPSLSRRYKALRTLADAGFWTTVRINPLFPTFPDGYFTDPASIHRRFGDISRVPKLPLLDITDTSELVDRLTDAKVPSVLAGFVRLSRYANNAMKLATGVDIKSFFRDDIPQDKRDKRYSDSEIAYYYKILQSALHRKNIRFSTCYIGNGLKDYFQYQDLWSNKLDCCDVRGNVSSFSVSSQDVSWSERLKHTMHVDAAKASMTMDQGGDVAFADSKTPGLTLKLGSSDETEANQSS